MAIIIPSPVVRVVLREGSKMANGNAQRGVAPKTLYKWQRAEEKVSSPKVSDIAYGQSCDPQHTRGLRLPATNAENSR